MNLDARHITRRQVLERYVLGTLEEDARAVLRAQVIGDPNVFAEVRAVELDLLDAATRDPESADGDLAEAGQRAGDGARVALGALREAVAAWRAHIRIWPAAAVWLAVAVVSLTLSQRTALDPEPTVALVPDPGAESTTASLADVQTMAETPPDGVPILRIDFSLSSGRLTAHVASPGGMFAGVWSLEIDGVRATRPQP